MGYLSNWLPAAYINGVDAAVKENGAEEAEAHNLQHDDDIGEEIPFAQAQDICMHIVRLVRSLECMGLQPSALFALIALRCCWLGLP